VILPDVDIGEGCRITKSIIDAGAQIPPGTVIGEDADEDRERGFRVTEDGITLVTPDMLGQQLHFTR
jgi:glucose-1-phosphate adenylyltransferase